MPSTVVHLSLAALLAAALLDVFDARRLAAVLVVVAVADLDTFVGVVLPGTHRALLHSVVPLGVAAALVAVDLRRSRSWLRSRGPGAIQLTWVALLAYLVAGIGPDLFTNGVNLFYPVYDRFFALSGDVMLSNHRGLVVTVLDGAVRGTTATTHYYTGVDVVRGPDPRRAERIFPVARGGFQLLLVLTAALVVGLRLRGSQPR